MRPRRSLIESEVQRLLTDCAITWPPVKLCKIVNYLGLEYIKVKDTADGAEPIIFTSSAKGRPAVFVNTNLPDPAQRYSVAHQLAHYILHAKFNVREGIVEPQRNWRSEADDPPFARDVYEAEADIFAVKLLIPQSLLKVLPKVSRKLDDIADKFNVPRVAVIPAYNDLLKKIRK
jgi:Zn-dependent peptidase ImmA (M78 family)